MDRLERAFAVTESAAEAARKSATFVVSQTRALVKAAQTGNIAAIKRTQDRLRESAISLQQDIDTATSAWSLNDDEEQRLFEEQFAELLQNAAEELGLKLYERDGFFISYPSIVRIMAADRAVRVDRKKVSTIRPSYLAALLHKNQQKTSSFSSQRFLEAMYGVYNDIADLHRATGTLEAQSGPVVPLARIYKLMTSLPGASREYDRSDFARDLYILDSKGPQTTRNGATVSFPASTGTRQRKSDLFSFVGPEGDSVNFYGIRFHENGG